MLSVMTASARIERTEKSVLFDDFSDPLETTPGSLLFAKKHCVVLVCGVVHCDDCHPDESSSQAAASDLVSYDAHRV